MNYHPVYLNLNGKKVVVIGGGKIAERKILSLIRAGADITVVSPSVTERILQEKSRAAIRHIPREFRKTDLKGAFLVIAATNSPETNKEVSVSAPALINVVDVPSECNFIAPSVVSRGPLSIAISTSGVSPAFAKTIRKELEKLYGPEFADYLKFVKKIRGKVLSEIAKGTKREAFLKSLGSDKIVRTLRAKGIGTIKAEVLERLERLRGIKK